MRIRNLIKADIPSLAQLAQQTYAETFGKTMSEEELEKALDARSENYFSSVIDKDVILVAIEDNQLVGFIQFGRVTYGTIPATSSDIELNKIYVKKQHQGKGIGSKLIEAMLDHDRLVDIKNIFLDVFAQNKKAISLYQRFGFKIIGKTPFEINGQIIGYDLLMKLERNI